MKLTESTFESLVAWGQYMHWADLQFQRFQALPQGDTTSTAIGTVAHWLSAEYVVLEGWLQLGLASDRVSQLLSMYPEHKDLLRRCRNAVYHFQEQPLDPRIGRCLKDEDEELRWSVALHFEFQGVLLHLSDSLRVSGAIGRQVSEHLVAAIGWFPIHPLASQIENLEALCAQFEAMVGQDTSELATDAKWLIEASRKQIEAVEMYPATSSLKRFAEASALRSAPSGA